METIKNRDFNAVKKQQLSNGKDRLKITVPKKTDLLFRLLGLNFNQDFELPHISDTLLLQIMAK